MNTPEFHVLPSPTIRTELLATRRELVPNPNALAELAVHTDTRLPEDALTAFLLREGEVPIPRGMVTISTAPDKEDKEDAPLVIESNRAEAFPEDPDQRLDVSIDALDEPGIVKGFAEALIRRRREAQARRLSRVAIGSMAAGVIEAGVSYVGFNNEALARPGYALFAAGLATVIYAADFRNRRTELPDLDGYSAPVQLREITDQDTRPSIS